MKQKIKNYLQFSMLLFGISLCVLGCQKDDDLKTIESTEIAETKFKISKIGKTRILENKKLSSKLEKLEKNISKQKASNFNKTVYSSTYDFYIETEYAKYIESADGAYHSYTFPIHREVESDSLENLLVSLQPDGSYKIMIITYNTTAKEKTLLLSGLLVDLEDKVTNKEINDDGIISGIFNKETMCYEIIVETCTCGVHDDFSGYDGCICYGETAIPVGCESNTIGGGSSPTGGDTGGPTGVSTTGSPTGGGQTSNGGSSTPSEATTPTGSCRGDDCPEEFDDGTPNTPCQELQEVSSTPSKIAKLIDLKNNTGLNQEVGFTRTDSIVGDAASTIEYQDMIWNAPLQQLVINTLPGQLYSDYAHTHYDTENQLSVFSLSDIYTIFSLLESANISSVEFNAFLVTEHGTKYALKFDNIQSVQDFVNFGNIWFSDWGVSTSGLINYESKENEIKNLFNSKIKSRKSNAKNEKNLVKFLEKYNMGLDLYKANDDFSQWEKVNSDGTTSPCP